MYACKDPREERTQSKRHRAINTVRVWLEMRPYLDKQFTAALYQLLPELKRGEVDEFEHHDPE